MPLSKVNLTDGPDQPARTMRRAARPRKQSRGDGTEMVNDTPARQKARELRAEARNLSREAGTLAVIEGLEAEAAARQAQAKGLREEAERLQKTTARIEDLTARKADCWKDTKRGRRNYPRWVCSWQEGDKIITKYLGSYRKMGESEALQKARRMKAKALAIKL